MQLEIKNIQQGVRECLAGWHKVGRKYGEQLMALSIFQRGYTGTTSKRTHLKMFIEQALARFATFDPISHARLLEHYIELNKDLDPLHVAPAERQRVYRELRDAVLALAQMLYDEELQLRANARDRLLGALANEPNQVLIGTQSAENNLIAQMLDSQANPIIYISGLGGIGKTALIRSVLHHIVEKMHFEYVVTVHYEPLGLTETSTNPDGAYIQMMDRLAHQPQIAATGLPGQQRDLRIKRALSQARYLVVVDNIEEQHVSNALLDRLLQFGGNTRFVVGSRIRPTRTVHHHIVQPLSQTHSYKLIRRVAQQANLQELAALPDSAYEPIYAVTGGNPLALKLAANMTFAMPLSVVVNELRMGNFREANGLFTNIFARLWDALSESAKLLLYAMTLFVDQADWQSMQVSSGLKGSEFWDAVNELVARSLLEVKGTIEQRRYNIHRLTAAYLEGRCSE